MKKSKNKKPQFKIMFDAEERKYFKKRIYDELSISQKIKNFEA